MENSSKSQESQRGRAADSDIRVSDAQVQHDSIESGNSAPDAVAPAVCPICIALGGAQTVYCSGFATDRARRESECAAIVESLGFCNAHAASLASRSDNHSAMAEVLLAANSKVVEILGHRELDRDLVRPLLFSAPDECPACASTHHRLTATTKRLAGDLTSRGAGGAGGRQPVTFCVPHFHALVAACDSAALRVVLPQEIDFLLRALAPILAAASEDANAKASGGALGLLAGDESVAGHFAQARLERRHCMGTGDDLRSLLDDPSRCPVCALVSVALDKWLEAVERAARIRRDVWTVFPICPDHIWRCAKLGDDTVLREVVRHAANVFVDGLRTGLATIEEHERALASASKSVWFKRKSPSYVLGQWRKAVTKLPACPACHRTVVARDRAIGQVLDALTRNENRRALERGHALCMKHFAHAYLLATGPGIRDLSPQFYRQAVP